MSSSIIFIGGIHGVGKGTLCSKIKDQLDVEHLIASELLKWTEVNKDPKNKLVADIQDMQDRLIHELKLRMEQGRKYLLDGHFCLFDSQGIVNRVPFATFSGINPVLVSVLITDPEIIVKRLTARDGKPYELKVIQQMQQEEVTYGKCVADQLGKPFLLVEKDVQPLVNAISQL
ncbi:ATP-binding protein [uncultured Algoriphagus sp.]|uniref:ATP-binding protein n=1 Tax=uncultured Algoriphagus sp. TaxID=417365 RepID=UPI0030ECCCAC|tara:strand:+ start:1149 stop:1670 length:522 start_codon:yes stop_codon:yes gene_type:complete